MSPDQRKVLLVENDRTVAEITKFRLELLGYRVHFVDSADAVFAAVESDRPDAIVMELQIAGMDGFELSTRLRNDERTSGIPIVAFSSNADLGHVQRAFAAGATEYVVKPYDPVVLERKLDKLLSVKHSQN